MADDFRAMVESAYNEAEAAAPNRDGDSGTSGAPPPDAAAAVGAGEAVGLDSPAPRDEFGDGAGSSAAQRARDKAGRFAPKGQAPKESQAPNQTQVQAKQGGEVATPAALDGEPPSVVGVAPVSPSTVKAPQSWTPAEREHFSKAPVEVQAAVDRREREVARALQEAAPSKKFEAEYRQAMAPFEGMFRQSGVNPIQAAQSAFNTIAQLQQGSPEDRAQIFAGLMRSYPTNVNVLAEHIDKPQQQQAQQMDPQAIVAQVRAQITQDMQQQRAESMQAKHKADVEAFVADPAHEFFQDVWADMAGLIDSAKARGATLSLKDAYQRAVWADPGLRDIMQSRAKAEAAKAMTASTQQARHAASSVKSTPSTGASPGPQPKNIRDMVASVWDSLDGR